MSQLRSRGQPAQDRSANSASRSINNQQTGQPAQPFGSAGLLACARCHTIVGWEHRRRIEQVIPHPTATSYEAGTVASSGICRPLFAIDC